MTSLYIALFIGYFAAVRLDQWHCAAINRLYGNALNRLFGNTTKVHLPLGSSWWVLGLENLCGMTMVVVTLLIAFGVYSHMIFFEFFFGLGITHLVGTIIRRHLSWRKMCHKL